MTTFRMCLDITKMVLVTLLPFAALHHLYHGQVDRACLDLLLIMVLKD